MKSTFKQSINYNNLFLVTSSGKSCVDANDHHHQMLLVPVMISNALIDLYPVPLLSVVVLSLAK